MLVYMCIASETLFGRRHLGKLQELYSARTIIASTTIVPQLMHLLGIQ